MKKLFNVPTDNQLAQIAQILNDELSDIKKESMSVEFELDKDLLRQVDEDYFYKINPNSNNSNFQPGSEVNVIVNGIKFKFIEKLDGN